MNINEHPRVVEAVLHERFVRDAAFLGVPETVAGFELKPFSLRHYLTLRIARNPILFGVDPMPGDLAQFLWTCAVEYSPHASDRKRFMKRCRRFVPPAPQFFETRRWRRRFNRSLLELAKCAKAARGYYDEAMMDKPGIAPKSARHADYYSEVAFWLSLFEYRYTPEQVLDMPMKVLWQCLNEARERKEKKPTLFNPSDRIKGEVAREARN